MKPAPTLSILMMEFLFWFTKPYNISIAHYILLCGQTRGIFKSWQLQFPGTPNAFLKSTNLFPTLWEVKQCSAKSNLIWRVCRAVIFVVTYFAVTLSLLFVRQKFLWIWIFFLFGNGFGKSWHGLDSIGSYINQVIALNTKLSQWKSKRRETFPTVQTFLFVQGFKKLWLVKHLTFRSYWQKEDILSLKIYLEACIPLFFLMGVL